MKKLFHAIVVVGAALTAGCGDSSSGGAKDASAALDGARADGGSDASPIPIDAGADARQDAIVIIL